jgi:putative transposase
VIKRFGLSITKACRYIGLSRSTYLYTVKDPEKDTAIKKRMREIVKDETKWGCPQVHNVLRREELVLNHKRTERIYYKEEKLSLRRRKRRRKASSVRLEIPAASRPNERWAMDFVHDSLWNGRKLRALNIIDIFTKEALKIELNRSITGNRVAEVLDMLCDVRGLPKYITIDNGPEFRSRALDHWAYKNQVTLDFIRPGKPVDNCYIESFNSRFREECLNSHYFDSVTEARVIIENWRKKYNEFRPHRSLKGLTPSEFAGRFRQNNMQNTNLLTV